MIIETNIIGAEGNGAALHGLIFSLKGIPNAELVFKKPIELKESCTYEIIPDDIFFRSGDECLFEHRGDITHDDLKDFNINLKCNLQTGMLEVEGKDTVNEQSGITLQACCIDVSRTNVAHRKSVSGMMKHMYTMHGNKATKPTQSVK